MLFMLDFEITNLINNSPDLCNTVQCNLFAIVLLIILLSTNTYLSRSNTSLATTWGSINGHGLLTFLVFDNPFQRYTPCDSHKRLSLDRMSRSTSNTLLQPEKLLLPTDHHSPN